ncbi:MAG TPA: hypothetical protein VFE51_07540 [Verrucomicrobiae bacterium]|nr:hypothetical protein [Verrucomicrobiae bacterium]
MSISASHTATFDNVAAFGPPSSRRKVAFWLLAGMWSVVCVEVPAGSTMFPFFTVWGVLVVWPLYLLHIVFFAGVVFRFGKPSFWPLYAAGMIFGMYEAYITKVVWTSFRPEGPFYTLGGIALFETIICALFLHPLLAFVVPLLLAELVLTSSNEVLLGLPRRIQNSILKRPALWLGALVAMFGLMQFVNSPSVISSFLSGAGNGLVLGLAVLWWRRTGGSFHSLRDLLPGPAGLKIFGGILLAWYIFWGFAIKPKSIPSILPGQLIVWLIYAALFLILYNCLLRSRRTTEPAYPEKQLSFGWRGFVLCFLWATLVTVTARLLLHRFALLQIAVFFSFYVLTGIALLIGAVVYAFGPHARLSMNLALLGSLLMGVLAPGLAAAQNLVSNGGFETGTNNWRSWSRSAGALTLNLDQKTVHSGSFALHLEHRAEQDWSLEPALGLEVRAGDVLQLECWVKVQGPGSVTLCASTWDEPGRVVEWSAGEHTVSEAPDWQRLSARVIVSENVARLQPRLIGSGPVEIWVDDYSVSRGRNILSLRPTDLPPLLTLSNAAVAVVFDTSNATFSVQDLVSGRLWRQQTLSNRYLIKKASVKSGELQCSLLDAVSGFDFTVTASLDAVQPELIVTLAGQGQLLSSLRFPSPFEGESGDYLVVPMNEGISYPVDDPSIPPIHLIAYGGHGICMAFFGMTDGQRGQMTILETPDDASIRIERLDGRLAISPEWDAQLGQFGYARRLRYVFFDHGGHVAMAKRYRAYAKETGLFKTLTEKQKVNPSVDRLIGAVTFGAGTVIRSRSCARCRPPVSNGSFGATSSRRIA